MLASDVTELETEHWEIAPVPAITPRWAFLSLIGFLVVLIIRPAELFPALGVFRLGVVTFAASLAAWGLSGNRTRLLDTGVGKLQVVFLLLIFCSVPLSVWPGRSLDQAVICAKQFVVFLLVANVLQTTAAARTLLAVVTVGQVFHAVVIVKRYASGELTLDRVFGLTGSIFSDPNELALNFVVCIPIAGWLVTESRSIVTRSVWLLAGMCLTLGTIATQSRGGFLGLVLVCIVGCWRTQRRWIALAAVLAIVLVGMLAAPVGSLDRVSTIGDLEHDESANTRLHVWAAGLRMWADYPMFGVGVGAFPIAYGNQYRDPSFDSSVWYDAHNSLVKALAELGIFGILVWCGILASAYRMLQRTWSQLVSCVRLDNDALSLATLCRTLQLALIGFAACSFFLTRAYDWILVILCGAAVAAARIASPLVASNADISAGSR